MQACFGGRKKIKGEINVKYAFSFIRKYGNSYFLLIPKKVLDDKSFPFKVNQDLWIKIKKNKLEVELP